MWREQACDDGLFVAIYVIDACILATKPPSISLTTDSSG